MKGYAALALTVEWPRFIRNMYLTNICNFYNKKTLLR